MKDRIKKIRRDLDLTQQEFADRLGVKRGTIANYEIGRNEPVDSIISLICREFNVSEEWLRNGTGEMFVPDAGDELEAVVKEYGLSNADQVILEKFVHLSDEAREAIINYMIDVVAALDGVEDLHGKAFPNGGLYDGIPDTPEELEKEFPPIEDDPDKKESGLG